MMTEIPEELEQEMQINALVDAFVLQLQLLSEMRDEIFTLYSSGHFDYQEGFQARYRFTVDGTGMWLTALLVPWLATDFSVRRQTCGRVEAIATGCIDVGQHRPPGA